MRIENNKKNNFYYGNIAGIFTGLLLQPLEVIKMNMILLPEKKYASKIGVYKKKKLNIFINTKISTQYIYNQEGFLGFYRGIIPSLIKSSFSSGFYFTIMRYFEYHFNFLNKNNKEKNSNKIYFFSSGIARALSSLLINPITIIKTRVEVVGNNEYKYLLKGLKKIYYKEGINAFFKGGLTILIRDFPFGGIFNLIYENLNRISNYKSNFFFINGLISGIIATTFTQPIEIVRAKLQYDNSKEKFSLKKSKIWLKLKNIYKEEGIKGFEKGLIPRLLRKPWANAMTFYIYEMQNKKNKK